MPYSGVLGRVRRSGGGGGNGARGGGMSGRISEIFVKIWDYGTSIVINKM